MKYALVRIATLIDNCFVIAGTFNELLQAQEAKRKVIDPENFIIIQIFE